MANLLEVSHVRRAFPRSAGEELLVLDDVNLTLRQGEIVGLLGRSGSGKSTLLRLIAGLARPQGGSLTYMGAPIEGPAQGVAMVFQSFALFPWLTVLENVQLGLEALGLPAKEIRARALAAIDLIGLDGYESAYPARTVRRHAPTGGLCPRRGGASQHPSDGRAVQRARCADGGKSAHRPDRALGQPQAADQGHHPGHPQYRGSGADVRPGAAVLLQSRPGEFGDPDRPAPAARPHLAPVRALCRSDLCRDDRAAGGAAARAAGPAPAPASKCVWPMSRPTRSPA